MKKEFPLIVTLQVTIKNQEELDDIIRDDAVYQYYGRKMIQAIKKA